MNIISILLFTLSIVLIICGYIPLYCLFNKQYRNREHPILSTTIFRTYTGFELFLFSIFYIILGISILFLM